MGAVTTPDGRVIYMPDLPGMVPPPVDASLAGAPNAAPSMVGQAAPQPSIFDILPPTVLQNITGQASAQPEPQAPTTPVQNSPDFAVTPKVEAKTGAALEKSNKQYEAGQRQRAAYAASPEGRIEAATQGQMDAIGAQEVVAGALGEVQAAEADEKARILEDRNVDLQSQQMDIEKTQRDREKKLGELRTQHDKLVKAEADYKVDRGRMWANKGTGAKVLAGIAVAMTAIGDALQGKSGPNLALQIITDAIDDDVNDQVLEFEQLGTKVNRARSSLDGYMKETGDIIAAKQMLQAQRRLQAADMLEASASKYENPKAKLNAMNNAALLRGSAAQLSGQSAEGRFARDMQREQIANAKAQVGLGYANLAQNKKEFDARMKLEDRKLLLEAAQLEQAGRAAEAKAKREEVQANNSLGIVAPATPVLDEKGAPVVGPDGTPQVRKDEYLKNQDGTIWRAPKEEVRTELAKKMAAATEITGIIDEVLAIRDRSGGESSWGNSDDYQRLKVLQNRLQLLQKSGTQGMSSDADMQAIREALGAGDVTSFRARAAGLEEGRRRTEDELNTAMKYVGNYSGERITFPSTRDRDPRLDNQDAVLKDALKADRFDQEERATGSFRQRGEEIRQKYGNAETADAVGARRENLAKWESDLKTAGINPAAKQVLSTTTAIMTSPQSTPAQKEQARATLKTMADKAGNEAVREAASAALLLDTQRAIGAPSPVAVPYQEFITPKAKAK